MTLAIVLFLAAFAVGASVAGWIAYIEIRRYRRYVYGENAPIPTKTFGQRAKPARPDGTSNRYAGGTER